MAALAVVIGLLLGASGPVALGALTTFQIAQLAIMGVKIGPRVISFDRKLIAYINSPAFRLTAAANGEAAIRWQQRQMEF